MDTTSALAWPSGHAYRFQSSPRIICSRTSSREHIATAISPSLDLGVMYIKSFHGHKVWSRHRHCFSSGTFFSGLYRIFATLKRCVRTEHWTREMVRFGKSHGGVGQKRNQIHVHHFASILTLVRDCSPVSY
jgi:hypothetical protein